MNRDENRVPEPQSAMPPPGLPEPAYPLARADLSVFLSGSTTTLVGRVDRGGAVIAANPALARRLGGPCPADLAEALFPESLGRWRRSVEGLGGGGRPRVMTLRFRRPPGEAGRAAGATYRCLLSPGAGGSVWILGEPIGIGPGGAALRRARRRALALAGTDHLTGLPNRRQAERWLAAGVGGAARRGVPLSCLMIDLDRFKAVNDTYGHPAGDLVLKAAARVLAGGGRSGDRVARYGGDEFVALLPATDRDGALAVAERLRAGLSVRPVEVPGSGDRAAVSIRLSASVGAAQWRPGEPAARLVARADAALARAKRAGRDRVEVDPP